MGKSKQEIMDNKLTSADAVPRSVRAWVGESLLALRNEARILVDDYWAQLKVLREGRKPYEIGTIGVRMRSRPTGSFSIEWIELAKLGQTGRSVASKHHRKGRSHFYPVDKMLAKEPDWIGDLVRNSEEAFSEIRKKQQLLLEIRDAMASYASHVTGSLVTSAMLVGEFVPPEREGAPKDEAA